MKLKIYEGDKKRYIDIDFWSFIKCWLIGWGTVTIMITICWLLMNMYKWNY